MFGFDPKQVEETVNQIGASIGRIEKNQATILSKLAEVESQMNVLAEKMSGFIALRLNEIEKLLTDEAANSGGTR